MTENNTPEQQAPIVQPAQPQAEGKKPVVSGLIDNANEAAERLERANAIKKELLEREEKLHALKMLGGQSEAGVVPPKPKEETPEEYAEKLMKGEVNPFKEDGFK